MKTADQVLEHLRRVEATGCPFTKDLLANQYDDVWHVYRAAFCKAGEFREALGDVPDEHLDILLPHVRGSVTKTRLLSARIARRSAAMMEEGR